MYMKDCFLHIAECFSIIAQRFLAIKPYANYIYILFIYLPNDISLVDFPSFGSCDDTISRSHFVCWRDDAG